VVVPGQRVRSVASARPALTPTLRVSSVPTAAATVSSTARLARGATARGQAAAPVTAGFAWTPNPFTPPGRRMDPNLTNLGPILRTILTAVNWPGNELRYQLSDLAPTVTPWSVPEMPVATTVNGTLNAATQIGDPISVKVITAPTQGTVTVTPEGFFTYTPDEALAGTPGNDTFTVKVTDEGFHLQSLFGIAGHSTTVEVPVSWQDLAPSPLGGDNYYGYYIYNYTGYTLTVTGLGEQQATTQAPGVGTQIHQGEYTFVQMKSGSKEDKKSIFYLDKTGPGLAEIAPPDVSGYDYTAITKLNYNYDGADAKYVYDKKTECSANSSAGTCDASNNDGTNIYLFDLPNTKFYVPGGTAAEVDVQNTIANKYVNQNGSNVDFLYPNSSLGYTPLTTISGVQPLVCGPVASCTLTISQTNTVADTSSHSQTVGIKVGLSGDPLEGLKLSAEASYAFTWGKSVTDTRATTVTQAVLIPGSGQPASLSGYTLFSFMASPAVYSTGTTTVTAYNDTYELLDTWYTWPNYEANDSLSQSPYTVFLACPSGGAACASMALGVVPAGFNSMQDPGDLTDPGYQACTTDCDYYYGVYGGSDPITGLTLLNLVSNYPTYYLSNPVGSNLTQG
jgi:hypothetical protein